MTDIAESLLISARVDAHKTCEVIIALSPDNREDVDSSTEAAASAGGKADVRELQDMSFMYGRSFEDLDGHVFEPMWMDLEAMTAN